MNDAALARSVDLRRVEEATFNCLPVRRQLLYDGWLLRLAPGATKRARSVTAFFASTLPLDVKIARCESVYAQAALPCLFRMTPFDSPPGLERELDARGYASFDDTLVQIVALDAPPELEPPADLDIDVAPASASGFHDALAALKGPQAGGRTPRRGSPMHAPLLARAIVARLGARPVAVGQATIDDGFAMLGSIATADDLRGRGLATAVVGALLAWAWERNAHHAFLQVNDDNHRALAVYRRFGFATAYAYRYRGRPGDGP